MCPAPGQQAPRSSSSSAGRQQRQPRSGVAAICRRLHRRLHHWRSALDLHDGMLPMERPGPTAGRLKGRRGAARRRDVHAGDVPAGDGAHAAGGGPPALHERAACVAHDRHRGGRSRAVPGARAGAPASCNGRRGGSAAASRSPRLPQRPLRAAPRYQCPVVPRPGHDL